MSLYVRISTVEQALHQLSRSVYDEFPALMKG